ncbi:type II toxin-antitoxin system RelE/ParE family toxin [Methylocystis sp.]|uniref:type II toxin-antitoxin system RelE/ParE family toxin n=1 Tax=Methylocystis sp. TaxID=1911079 RepID=UPI0025E154C7|nr:type II toxin-antitoxin system RelE/ParE family toxin [Methylocystis sp.]
MKLRYTLRATAELDEILSFIDERSPQGARSIKARIQAMTALLLRHPQAGHPTSKKSGLRRMVVYPYPYLIFYRATETEIIIHGVRHSARRPSPPKTED